MDFSSQLANLQKTANDANKPNNSSNKNARDVTDQVRSRSPPRFHNRDGESRRHPDHRQRGPDNNFRRNLRSSGGRQHEAKRRRHGRSEGVQDTLGRS